MQSEASSVTFIRLLAGSKIICPAMFGALRAKVPWPTMQLTVLGKTLEISMLLSSPGVYVNVLVGSCPPTEAWDREF